MANKDNAFILTTNKSKLSHLTSGDGNHGIKYLVGGAVVGPAVACFLRCGLRLCAGGGGRPSRLVVSLPGATLDV